MKDFNVFDILAKDDKELIHSAFIAFLLQEENYWFIKRLFGIDSTASWKIETEKKFGKGIRIDIFLESAEEVIIVEIKFKSLPTTKQLNTYSDHFNEKYNNKIKTKYLIYFAAGQDFTLPSDWKSITYEDILKAIQEFLSIYTDLNSEKKIFIKHYANSIANYIQKYQSLKENPKEIYQLFKEPNTGDKNNKFWIQLILNEVKGYLQKTYQIGSTVIGGGVYFPVLDAYFEEWEHKNENYAFYLQLNGGWLKYSAFFNYVPGSKPVEGHKIIEKQKARLRSSGFNMSPSSYNNSPKMDKKSGFIYKENILQVLSPEEFTIEGIGDYIIKFKDRIDLTLRSQSTANL